MAKTQTKAPGTDADGSGEKPQAKLALVKVKRAIAFDGVVVRPGIDDSKRGRPPIITPVEAVIPHDLAESFGPNYVEILGNAPAGARVGLVEKKK